MKLFKKLKIQHRQLIILTTTLLLVLIMGTILVYVRIAQSQRTTKKAVSGIGLVLPARQPGALEFPAQGKPTPTPQPTPTPTPTPNNSAPGPTTIQPSPPGNPTLTRLELVTNQAFGDGGTYVPNGWGVQKNRIIRLSTGDLFTVYISAGSGTQDREWHLMHRAPGGGGWQEIKNGDAGAEPINILRGPNDEIHLFAWPGVAGQLHHIESTDGGQTFTDQVIPGQWTTFQGYSGSGINAQGDIVFFQTGNEQPGTILWTYYSHTTQQWQFHISTIDQFRYTYAFIFPGTNNDLTFTAMRDVERPLLGYASASGFNYIFNAIKYFTISDVNNPNVTSTLVSQVQPQSNQDSDVTYLTDTYIDTQGRTHLLYNNQYDGSGVLHHVIIDNGQVVKDVQQNISYALKARIVQDTLGHFYIIATDHDNNTLNIYPGSASDTDGTQLNPPVQLDISQYPRCDDADFCHEPTFTEPRNGNQLADYIDGTYGNFTQEIYFRVQLRADTAMAAPANNTRAHALITAFTSIQSFIIDEKRHFSSNV